MYPLYVLIVLIIVVVALIRKKMAAGSLSMEHFKREVEGADKVLYLRSFKLDGKGMVGTGMDMFEGLNLWPVELDLAKALLKYPFHLIAVGRHGQEMSDIGFDRIYFEDNVWQEEVMKLINESVLIIYRPDPSDSVLWELNQVLNSKADMKTIIWADMGYNTDMNLNKSIYHVFQRKALESTGVQFPDFNKWKSWIALDLDHQWQCYSNSQFRSIPAFEKATVNNQPIKRGLWTSIFG